MSEQLTKTIQEINQIDKSKLIRSNLGDASLKEYKDFFDEIFKKSSLVEKYSKFVDTNTNNQVHAVFEQIKNHLKQLESFDKTAFVANQKAQVDQINANFENLKKHMPIYGYAALEFTGILDSISDIENFNKIAEDLKTKTNEAISKIESESRAIITQAKAKAEEIEKSVRKTAQKVSVEVAQKQFENAAINHRTQIKIWGLITGILICAFIGFIWYLLSVEISDSWTWKIIYFSVIRIAILSLIGAILAFSFKMLKAHLHMLEHNLHRQRIANSISSFVESALSNEQRDLILTHLVEAVVGFGNSGIIEKDEDSTSKISIDNITRSITGMGNN